MQQLQRETAKPFLPGLLAWCLMLVTCSPMRLVHVDCPQQRLSSTASIIDWVVQVPSHHKALCPLPELKIIVQCNGICIPGMQVTKDAFQQLLGKEPKVAAIHAGLECGIIGEKVPGMDAVSYGPTITGAHSPDEQVNFHCVTSMWLRLGSLICTCDCDAWQALRLTQ